jgi:hypothetical protein
MTSHSELFVETTETKSAQKRQETLLVTTLSVTATASRHRHPPSFPFPRLHVSLRCQDRFFFFLILLQPSLTNLTLFTSPEYSYSSSENLISPTFSSFHLSPIFPSIFLDLPRWARLLLLPSSSSSSVSQSQDHFSELRLEFLLRFVFRFPFLPA